MSSDLPTIPPDDRKRNLVLARPDTDPTLPHFAIVGDTYTILVTGEDTNGRFCLIDMHILPAADRRRTAMNSRRLSPCWKANWKQPSEERSQLCAQAKQYTFPQTRRINSTMLPLRRYDCTVSALLRDWINSSWRPESRWRRALRPRQN